MFKESSVGVEIPFSGKEILNDIEARIGTLTDADQLTIIENFRSKIGSDKLKSRFDELREDEQIVLAVLDEIGPESRQKLTKDDTPEFTIGLHNIRNKLQLYSFLTGHL